MFHHGAYDHSSMPLSLISGPKSKICQLFVDPALSSKISHVEGAARLLKSRGIIGPVNDFEKALLMSVRGSVVCSARLSVSRPADPSRKGS